MRVSIPEELRPTLRALASAVVAVAQESYRDHLDASTAAATITRRATDTRGDQHQSRLAGDHARSSIRCSATTSSCAIDSCLALANADPEDAALVNPG